MLWDVHFIVRRPRTRERYCRYGYRGPGDGSWLTLFLWNYTVVPFFLGGKFKVWSVRG
ncbi:hypothetical protein CJF32_00009923 [Rutstroemia sp. NJR-2017a WRK4]|nr:hypothetical protein CJF32_00009923 [Rutstroemia sp. NJR-2017a WRK4]